MQKRKNLQCDICGKFISYKDFEDGKAKRELTTPDSALTSEDYETYHIECMKKEEKASISYVHKILNAK